MAWIESHQDLGAHPKLLRLARMLDISQPCAVGHLQYLWWWALDYAPDGNIVGYDALDIAIGAKWDGDPDDFVKALTSCGGSKAGFLDRTDDGWEIHDWDQFGGKLHARKVASEKANHTRHHANQGVTAPDCRFCASERSPNGVRTESEPPPDGSAADSTVEESREDKRTEELLPSGDITARTLLAEHIEACDTRPPDRVVGHLGREIKTLLVDEELPADAIRAGLDVVRRKALHPSTLASAVNEAINPPEPKRARSSDLASRYEAAAAHLEEQGR